jgi:hypothetical protein
VVIAQAALAFFEIGFQEIGRIAESFVTGLVGFHQPVDDLAGMPQDHLLAQLLRQGGVKAGHAANETCVKQRRQNFIVLAGQ